MTTRVLVVGGGVIGLCVALYCLRRGFAVTVVEREPRVRAGCSFGNAGMIVPSHFVPLAAPGAVRQGLAWMRDPRSPFYIRPRASPELLWWLVRFARSATRAHVGRAAPLLRDLCLASRACSEALAVEANDAFGLVKQGLLLLCRTPHAFAEECATADQARALGIAAEAHTGAAAAALDASVRADLAGAIRYPLDCSLSPPRLMACLEHAVARAGGVLRFDTEIAGWSCDASRARIRAAQTADGDALPADEFVVCAGSWSPQTVRGLRVRIPIEAGKGYSLTLPAPAGAPALCAILAEARVAVTPMGDTVRVGGTMELSGLDRGVDARRVDAIVDAIPRYYATLRKEDFTGVAPWSGLRPVSPDGLPYIGRVSRHPNLTIAAGHAMMGVTLGPVTGQIVAGLLAGEAPPYDMRLLSPDRFATL